MRTQREEHRHRKEPRSPTAVPDQGDGLIPFTEHDCMAMILGDFSTANNAASFQRLGPRVGGY